MPKENIVQTILLIGVPAAVLLATFLITVIVIQVRKYLVRRAELEHATKQAEIEADLKAGMIERGFTADQIERVLAAKISSPRVELAETTYRKMV